MLTTEHGMIVRIPVKGIRIQGRNTMGVIVMRLNKEDRVVSVTKIIEENNENDKDDEKCATTKKQTNL